MKITEIYNETFYDAQAQDSYQSARNLLPYVNKIFAPKSVVDIGCGVGTWLKAWADINPHIQIAGVDGNEVDSQMYFIPSECYKCVDLTQYYATLSKEITQHFAKTGGEKPFDLAQSLEVAEHLDEGYADNFVALLTSLSNIILFSAAIPYQGGTHHVNCQPPAYWAKKFAQYDFECYDILRMKFWDNNAIASHYRQNSLIFIHKSGIACKFHTDTKSSTFNAPKYVGTLHNRYGKGRAGSPKVAQKIP